MKINSNRAIFLISIFGIYLLFSCTQQEGIGGNSSIVGKIMVNYYNDDFSQKISDQPEPAKDEDVFLVFGDDSIVGDKVTTSFTGNFEFEYLWPGKYKLYYFTEDTSGISAVPVEVVKEITLGKNETLDFNDLIINKKIKKNEGSSFIKGKLKINYYNDDFSMLLSEEAVPAKDEDIYLILGNNSFICDRVKTSFNGEYQFEYLWQGDYKIYYYSDDSTGKSTEKLEIVNNITLKQNETKTLDDLYIKRSLKWDEGTSSIKGTVNVINYKNSSTYPNLELKDITPAQDQDIYITYGNHLYYDERIPTSSDGTFVFQNLIKGKYKIFLYSEDVSGGTAQLVVEKEITITEDHQNVVIDDIIYIKKL